MNKLYALTNDKSWKSAFIHEGKILLLNKAIKTEEKFLEEYSTGGLLKKKDELSIDSINFMSHENADTNDLMIKGSGNSHVLEFSGNAPMLEFVECILKEKNLEKSTRKHSIWETIMNPAIGAGLSILFGIVVYMEASDVESGVEINISGRKQLYKRLLLWVAETLGSKGTLVVFSLALIACIYWAYRKLKNPGEQIEYKG